MNAIIRTAKLADAVAITRIYNQGIDDRGATFETTPQCEEEVARRIADENYPLLVAVAANDAVLAWAGLSSYRSRACFAGIAELSIYVAREARGQRTGQPLLTALIDAARDRGFRKLVSRIFPFNASSRALCARCGFREVGVYEKHGQLDGRWLDVVIVERLISEKLTGAAGSPTA